MSLPRSEREIQIGQRLREFRESKRISRTAFALSIGIGSERLASYESGRVPLRCEVFLAIHRLYFLNPVWLATGQELPAYEAAVDFGRQTIILQKWSFSEAYDRALRSWSETRDRIADGVAMKIAESINRLLHYVDPKTGAIRMTSDIAFRVRQLLGPLDSALENISHLGLTRASLKRKNACVKIRTLDQLRAALRAQTAEKGAKGLLARDLNVPQARVSEWLSGKKEPAGETTLRLLNWVEQPERQQENPGRASTQPGPKTQVHKSKANEKANSNPKTR